MRILISADMEGATGVTWPADVEPGTEQWQRRLERWTPTVAGLVIQDTTGLRSLVITPWAGLGVLAIWAAAAILAGGLVFRFRDV